MNTTREAEVVLKVNSKEAQDKLERLQAQAKDLRERFADAFRRGDTRGIEAINKDLIKVNKEISLMRTNAANIRAAMTRLDQATPRELQRTIKLINNELNSGRVRRGSKEWDEYIQKLRQVQGELAKVKRDMQVGPKVSFLGRIKNGINGWGATAAAAAAFGGVVMSGKAAVQAYADMEAEEANVRKYTGMTAEQVAGLNEEFKKMDTRTSREDLNKLAQEAGRLGKTSTEDVLGFVRAADKINVALDDLGEGATLTLSKLTGIFGDEAKYGTEKSLLKVGSVINELSQNCSASAPYLAEFSSRLGGIAAQAKMSVSQVMAFAAVLDENNLAVEASSTAVGQLITKIYQDPAKMAKAAGLDVKKFSEMVKTDMNGALVMLLEHLNKFGGMETLAKVFDNMGTDGARAIPVLSALAGHVEKLKWQQEQANAAFAEGTSVSKEFDVQNNTVQARLDKLKKGFNEMAVNLGEQLLPVMQHCISGSSLFMRVLSSLIAFFIQHKTSIIILASAIALYTTGTKLAKAATTAWNAVVAIGNAGMIAWRAAVISGRIVMLAFTQGIGAATRALHVLNAAGKFNVFGIILTAVTAAALALSKLIDRTSEYTKKMREARNTASSLSEDFYKEMRNIDSLVGKLEAAKKGTKEYEKVKTDIINQYGQYLNGLINERGEITNLAAAYNRLAAAARIAAKERAIESARESADSVHSEAFNGASKRLLESLQKEGVPFKDATRITTQVVFQLQTTGTLSQDLVAELESLKGNFQQSWGLSSHPVNIVNEMVAMQTEYQQTLGAITEVERENNALAKYTREDLESLIENIKPKVLAGQGGRLIIGLHEPQPEVKDLSASELYDLLAEARTRLSAMSSPATPQPNEPPAAGVTPTLPESEKERREREKREREAQKKAKEALKKDLDERKSLYLRAEAENSVRYYTGEQDYAAYLAKKEQLETEYAEDVIKIHQQHDELDKVGYAQALKDKADLLKKHEDEQRKPRLRQVEADHRDNTDAATMAFYDPSSDVFQNQRLLNQMLFQEDIRYLNEKAALYKEGSEERAKIEQEIADRTAKDQLDKQKETAEALVAFEQQYRRSSGSVREQNELAIMAELHQRCLISEEEYQRAVKDIKDKYRREDIDKARTVQSEYTDMVLNLTTSFKKFFDELGQEGTNFWDNLSNLASSAFAVMSAFISQFSAYASAERDLELAKTEKRYDKEIQAAGKNTKKKEKLEKQKEADLARIKKKYNDKEMKMQLAQAVAQTAVAAINAYASGSKVNVWLGPVAAALATAAGMVQIATIKKQHEAQAAGYYEGGFTARHADDRREVGVVHANEFVANHQAVANPALAPVLRLIDTAQRNNTVGSLTAADVSNAIGQGSGVSARGEVGRGPVVDAAIAGGLSAVARTNSRSNEVIGRLSDILDSGIEARVILDGEDGFHKKYTHYKKLIDNPKR